MWLSQVSKLVFALIILLFKRSFKPPENNKYWWECREIGSGNINGPGAVENGMAVPYKIKQNCHMIQQFYFWVYAHKNWKQELKHVFVDTRS